MVVVRIKGKMHECIYFDECDNLVRREYDKSELEEIFASPEEYYGYDVADELGDPEDSPFYEGGLDMDQQSAEFWDNWI